MAARRPEGAEVSAAEQLWVCGLPGWHHEGTRRRIQAPDRDAAALAYAQRRWRHERDSHEEVAVVHTGRGYYDVVITRTGLFAQLGPRTISGAFRVQRVPDQSRRGVDEGDARQALAALHAPAWVLTEVQIVPERGYPLGRADLVVLPDDGSSLGIEIKTDRDSLSRLAVQVPAYLNYFARCALATTPRHLDAALVTLPLDWGVYLLDPASHAVTETMREAQDGPERYTHRHLLDELWSDELVALLAERGHNTKRSNNTKRTELLLGMHTPEELRRIALDTLRNRKGTRVAARRVEP